MDEETVHREHEMDALMQASMGDEEDHEEDEWFQNVSQRLETISISPTCQHKDTIQNLHAIIEEAMQRQQEGLEAAERVLVAAATRQEKVYCEVIRSQREKMERLEKVIAEVDGEVGGASPNSGYVNGQKQLHSLQRLKETLTQCASELDEILETPLPIELSSSAQEEDGEEQSHTPSIIQEAASLHSNAQMLHLKFQSTSQDLATKLDLFAKNLQQEKERFLDELVDVEKWLTEVYDVLTRDPNRDQEISYSIEEVYGLQEEYSEEGVNVGGGGGGLTLSEQVKQEEGVEESLSVHREVSISGSSLGSELLEMVEPEALESSVDVDLEDEEYEKQVLEQVLSDSSPSPSPSPLDTPNTSTEQIGELADPFGDPVDPVGQQWAESMEEEGEETDFQTETESISSESTLREAPNRSPDSKRAAAEFSEEEVNPEEVKGHAEEEEKKGIERQKSLADELGELGLELEEEFGEKEVKSEEEEEQESEESGGGESVSEEGSEVSSEGAGLHWVAGIRLVPMYCDVGGGEGEREGEEEAVREPCYYDLDHILQELESHSSQLQSRNHKIKSAMANINVIINASPEEVARELQKRLEKVKVQWEPLALRLRQRKEQLLFEKKQTEALESLHEAVRELEAQPQNNMTHAEVEESYSQIMEFFQDVDTFEALGRDHVSQLESTLQPLLGQREGLLGDGRGARHLLQKVVEDIREGYKRVEDQLRLQKQNLEQWLEEWSQFNSGLSRFQNWVEHAEGVVSRDCYGNDVRETERYQNTIRKLKESLQEEEKKVEKLVDLGNVLLVSVGKGTNAEAEVDLTLTDSETRWYNLVEKVDSQETAINKVLIAWRGYGSIYHAARTFISQMTKMVGTEPVESSNGNTSLLPTYRTYGDQVKAMQVQYSKLLEFSEELTSNPMVGGRSSITMETRDLRGDWERLKDNVMDSLTLLQREYDDWVHHQLQKMGSLVKEMGEIVARETRYVENMPLTTFLQENTEALLAEANSLIECQDKLAQLEEECVSLDKQLLERASQQSSRDNLGEDDNPRNTEDHLQLQAARDRYQLVSEAVLPVINIFYLQLQLLQKIHQGQKVVGTAMEAAGNQAQLESLLTDLNLSMSEYHFEQLRGDAYDLGTVTEDCELEGQEQHGVSLPQYEELVQINRSLTGEIETLCENTTTAKLRLQLFIEWWVEFHGNHGELTSWLEEAESRLDQMEARAGSSEAPLVSPVELLTDAKELEGEMGEKEMLLSALTATAQNISEEFPNLEERGEEDPGVTAELETVRGRWEGVRRRLELQKGCYEDSSSRFNSFLTRFTGFCNWLCEIHDQLLELCETVPHRATPETIATHKNKLEEYQREVWSRRRELEELQSEGGNSWGDYLVPEETQNQIRLDDSLPQSPVATTTTPDDREENDFPFEEHLQQLPYFRNKMVAMTTKWGGVQRLLRDRESQLELSLGNMVLFLEGAEQQVEWVGQRAGLECVGGGIPASLPRLQALLSGLGEVTQAMAGQEPVRKGLLQSGENLIGQVSGPNAAKVTEMMEEMRNKWEELENAIATRTKDLSEMSGRVEVLLVKVRESEDMVEEGERRMTDCGPIGADPVRLVQQQEILDTLDGELLEKKKFPEDLVVEAMNIIRDCTEGSGVELRTRVEDLQNQFDGLCESCYEAKELCEEATAAIQAYQAREKVFLDWLAEASQKLEERISTKRPIGTIHTEAEEFSDFMKEMEQHTEDYGQLRTYGNSLAAKYKPSDALDEMMSSLHHQWEEFVSKLFGHSEKLHSLAEKWDMFEREVKNLLNWIMSEANRFSGEVTNRGEKGVEDHIQSCKTFSDTLESKKGEITQIQALADELQEEDGEKNNGTCDVDSRWNDVHQHWTSLCKLLLETLIRLEATHAELQHILMIRSDEFDWLGHSEREAADRRCCHGDVGRVEEEIVRQQQLLSEVEGHNNEVEFIQTTVEFLLEHTSLSGREDVKLKAADFSRRYDDLLNSLKTYVGNLKESVPLWNEFNAVSQELGEWLDHAHLQLTSDLTQPGNAIVTETSLRNVELLLEELAGHEGTLETLRSLTSSLAELTPPEDKDYVCEVRDELVERTGDVAEQTRDRSETLEQRLKSWQVFPVAEAQAVQAFLQQVQFAMEEGGEEGKEEGEGEEREVEEEMTYEQLQEKLRRLEELQQLQQSNREKLSAINQSVESPEVQAALQRNPDISKERSNLLQGWSSMSEALTQRIAAMKMRAEMMREMEGALGRMCEGVRELREEVDKPLPPSPLLEASREEILQRQAVLCEKCQEEMTGLNNLFDRFSTSPELEIPVRITDKAATARKDFEAASEKAEQKAEMVARQLEMWAELKSLLPRLFSWLRGAVSELSCLRKIPEFATEFSSLESRLEDLREQISENKESVQRLQTLAEDHLSSDDHPNDVQKMKKKLSRVQENWRALNEGMESLVVAVAPWKEMTDRFDELQDWFDQFRERVRRDLSDLEQEEENSANMSDYIVNLKDHLLKMEQQGEALAQLTNQSAELLSGDVCNQHGPAAELREQVSELEDMWAGEEQLLRHSLSDVEEKEAEWKRQAVSSIRQLSLLSLNLSSKDEALLAKERELERQRGEIDELKQSLRTRPTARPIQQRSSFCRKFLIFFIFFLLLTLAFLSLFYHDVGSHLDLSPLVFDISTAPYKPI